MAEPDDTALTPEQMRDWLAQEIRDLTKALELRLQDAMDFVTAYSAGKISEREMTDRLNRYDIRWGDPIYGVHAYMGKTNEEILSRLDQRLEHDRVMESRYGTRSGGRER